MRHRRLKLAFVTAALVCNELHSVAPVDKELAIVVQEDDLVDEGPRQGLLTLVAVLQAISQVFLSLDLILVIVCPPSVQPELATTT